MLTEFLTVFSPVLAVLIFIMVRETHKKQKVLVFSLAIVISLGLYLGRSENVIENKDNFQLLRNEIIGIWTEENDISKIIFNADGTVQDGESFSYFSIDKNIYTDYSFSQRNDKYLIQFHRLDGQSDLVLPIKLIGNTLEIGIDKFYKE